ncbi:MAG: ABC-F family ATP-binding cassette domain-containing protein [Defluviitaleaceae bacterium]|nr:ABC-F family ATP-binding cassette domain-containing protein [Defluviitaleaceae bacterium]
MLLQIQNAKKFIGAEEILSGVSFHIEEKEKTALVGINGAGKTSVFRLITGEWQADEGSIICAKNTRIGYLSQATSSVPLPISNGYLDDSNNVTKNEPRENSKNATAIASRENSKNATAIASCENSKNAHENSDNAGKNLYEVLESVFLPLKKMEDEIRALESEMGEKNSAEIFKRYDNLINKFKDEGGYERESRLKGVLRGLGFGEEKWTQPFEKFSGGERTRALLAKLLLEQNDLLLLDEPTNHLDIESIAWLEDFLKNFRGAVLVISHDRFFLNRVATKTIEIENKKSVVYHGNYSFFVNKKAADRAAAEKSFAEQQKILKHHEEVIKTIRNFKTEAALIRAKSREKMLDKIERVDAPTKDPAKMRLRLTPNLKSGGDVLFAENLSMGFGAKKLFCDVNFEIKRGEKIAVIGANGIGKTTLIKILAGEISPQEGRVREGVNLRVGYYDQSHAFSAESEKKSIFQEISDTYPKLSQTEIRTTLAAFMFVGDDVFKPICALSGGERGRVQLSKIMLAGANFLILDEPTNHLDLVSKEILEDALREFAGTLIFISHDRYFINNVATKILELTSAGLTEFFGNYDYYLEKRQAVSVPVPGSEENAKKINAHHENYLRKKENDALIRKKKSRIEKLETEISQTENKISECEEKLNSAEVNTNADAAHAVFSEKIALEKILAEMYDEWEDLNES